MEQINKIKSDAYRILKKEDLLLFESACDYEVSVKHESDILRSKAIEEIELIKNETKSRLVAEVHQQQKELMDNLDKKLATTFSRLRDDLYLLVYKVLHEFGLFLHTTAQIKQVIEHELDKYDTKLDELVIYANSHTREQLLVIYNNLKEKLRLDESLADDECILESKLYIFRLNLADATNKLDQLLKGHNT